MLREINTAAVPLGFKPTHRFVGPVDALVGDLTGKNLIAALRETLSNAFRHAHAARIDVVVDATVTLPDGREGVRLTVADDGVGIPEGGRLQRPEEPQAACGVPRRGESARAGYRGGRGWYDGGVGGAAGVERHD